MFIFVRYGVTIVRRSTDCISSWTLFGIRDGWQEGGVCTRSANILFFKIFRCIDIPWLHRCRITPCVHACVGACMRACVHAFVRIYGNLWELSAWELMRTYGNLWELMGTYGNLWELSACELMGTYGNLWELMGTYGNLWELMGTYGNLWELMGTYGNLARGNLWELMGTYGNLYELGHYGQWLEWECHPWIPTQNELYQPTLREANVGLLPSRVWSEDGLDRPRDKSHTRSDRNKHSIDPRN